MRRIGSRPARQRGIALITAVLVAALVAALSMTLASRTRLWLNQVQNRQDSASAQSMAFSAIDLARLTLRDDARNNHVDHLQESWAMPIPAVNAEEGRVAGRIVELQGRFNLANLVKSGKLDSAALAGLRRLFTSQGLDPARVDALESALTKEVEARSKAKVSAVFPYVDLADLAQISGFDPALLARLESVAVVLPARTRLNVNFASPEVLAAVLSGVSAGEAGSVIGRRAGGYFSTVSDFRNAFAPEQRGKVDDESFSVESSYFLVETDAWFGRVHLRYQALLARSGNGLPEVIWVRRAYGGNG